MSHAATLRSDVGAPKTVSGTAVLPLVGRIAIAAIFLLSGLNKLAAPASTIAYIESVGLPFPPIAFGVSAAVEVLGGIALILGFRTRITATIMAPIVEETVFRGYFYPTLKRYLGPVASCLLVSLLFAATHGSVAALASNGRCSIGMRRRSGSTGGLGLYRCRTGRSCG